MRCDGITASGMLVEEGICACGDEFQLGTLFYLADMDRAFVCMDRGNKITNNRLDLYFTSRERALDFGIGVQTVEVKWWEVNHEQRERHRATQPR